ncbi:MAG: hypothetical protein HAW66_05765 [Shewanella sp.]|nr:hypothetical protein [Shewanella sp.]
MKYLLSTLVVLFFSTTIFAHPKNTDSEIHQLRQEVKQLHKQVRRLKAVIASHSFGRSEDVHQNNNRKQWGCYLDDITAGGVYGTGRSEAEARGKTLEKCKDKSGVCFDNLLKCSQAN